MDYWNGGAPAVLANQGKKGPLLPSGTRPTRDGEFWLQVSHRLCLLYILSSLFSQPLSFHIVGIEQFMSSHLTYRILRMS